jgi:hypothetical protein
MTIERMDPEHRAPSLVPAFVVGAITVALAITWWSAGLFSELGNVHQVFWD